MHVIDVNAVDAFNRLGLLAVPSDATAQRKRLRHHARLKMRQLLKSQPDGQSIRRLVVEGTPFVEIAKFARGEGIDLVVLGSYGGRSDSMEKSFLGRPPTRSYGRRDARCSPFRFCGRDREKTSSCETDVDQAAAVSHGFFGVGSSGGGLCGALAASWRAELTVMTVLEFPPGMDPEYAVNKQYLTERMSDASSRLAEFKRTGTAARHCGDNTNRHRDSKRRGHCRGCRGKVRFVIVGTRGKSGLAHVLLGSTAERVIRTAPCPVLAVHTTKAEGRAEEGMCLDRILVPTDFSECSSEAANLPGWSPARLRRPWNCFTSWNPVLTGSISR